MEGEQKLNFPVSRKTSVKKYSTEVFKESSVNVISRIVSTESIPKKLARIFILLVFLTGFLYQCGTYLKYVFQYPTNIDIETQMSPELPLPAYTFCSNNGIKRSKYCRKYPRRCVEAGVELCSKYPYYCRDGNTLMPKNEFYIFEENMTLDEFLDVGESLEDILYTINDKIKVNIDGPFFKMKRHYIGLERLACYTYNSLVNSSKDQTYYRKDAPWFNRAVRDMIFTANESEVFIPGNRAGILFTIHSPFEAVNPFENGYFLKPGRSYKIHVTMEKEELLQSPYSTNCVNYTERWLKNNRTGPRRQEMCQHKCLLDLSMKCLDCAFAFILYPTQARICDETLFSDKDMDCLVNNSANFDHCTSECKDDCSKMKYYYEVQEGISYLHVQDGEVVADSRSAYIHVEVYLDNEELIILKHIPKYMTVEVFSDIGGYIGLWLGISLVELTDLLESLFRISRYAVKRHKSNQTKRNQNQEAADL